MKRRIFGLFTGTSLLALLGPKARAYADSPDPSLLKTTLTPTGAERAGNAAGTIPAWTGGMTEIPAGFDWDPDKTLPPDFFAADQMLYKVDASNMAQYDALLSDGVKALMQRNDFYIKVYPTHRTHACPQWVYDNTALNVTRTTPQDGEYRLGFNGAYGGYPCPIPSSDPMQAGAQIVWNHQARWFGEYFANAACIYTSEGGAPVLVSGQYLHYKFHFYQKGGSPENFNGYLYSVLSSAFAPGTIAGEQSLGKTTSNIVKYPQMVWSVLTGQGRVRRDPNLMYDTPASFCDAIYNYDEPNGFAGPEFKYDWKLLGKQEMLVPYNNNKVFSANSAAVHKPKYFDPEYMRWELHRVWVVEATLHKSQRNVLAKRRLYIDEDDWMCRLTDAWDAANNLLHVTYVMSANFPNLPGNIYLNGVIHNMQTGQYCTLGGSYADPPYNMPWSYRPVPDSTFDPQSMAATEAY